VFRRTFETGRLRFEQYSHDAVSPREVYAAFGPPSPTVEAETRYLPWDPVETVGAAADRIDRFERLWDERERAEWLIYPTEDEPIPDGIGDGIAGPDANDAGAPIAGSAGLIFRWDRDLALPAIWLRKPYWGRGYSGERADALLEIAFDRLDVGMVAIPLHRDNERSYSAVEAYVERHGGRYEGLLRHHSGRYDEPVDHHRFSIGREEYLDSGGSESAIRR
jgi:RimJ/RimL family protein N-acetyltransferase